MNDHFSIKNLKNIIFFGANESLDKLIEINKKYKIKSIIITSNDQKKSIPKNLEYEVFNEINANLKKFIKNKVDIEHTIFLSVSSRWIFKKNDIKNFFKNRILNFHPSRLPFDSGGGGYSWRIMNNDRISNLLIHLVNEKIDDGPILHSKTSIFPFYCKTPDDFYSYEKKLISNFYESFVIKILKNFRFKLIDQPQYLKTYFPRLNSEKNSWINWDMNDLNLIKFINAFDSPYIGAKTFINKKRVSIKKAQLHGGEITNHNFFQGLIIRKEENFIVVATKGPNSLVIEEVIDKNKKNIIKKLKVGDRFFTPISYIEESLIVRAIYGPNGLIK